MTFKEFLSDQGSNDEIYFYLFCRFSLNQGAMLENSSSNHEVIFKFRLLHMSNFPLLYLWQELFLVILILIKKRLFTIFWCKKPRKKMRFDLLMLVLSSEYSWNTIEEKESWDTKLLIKFFPSTLRWLLLTENLA